MKFFPFLLMFFAYSTWSSVCEIAFDFNHTLYMGFPMNDLDNLDSVWGYYDAGYGEYSYYNRFIRNHDTLLIYTEDKDSTYLGIKKYKIKDNEYLWCERDVQYDPFCKDLSFNKHLLYVNEKIDSIASINSVRYKFIYGDTLIRKGNESLSYIKQFGHFHTLVNQVPYFLCQENIDRCDCLDADSTAADTFWVKNNKVFQRTSWNRFPEMYFKTQYFYKNGATSRLKSPDFYKNIKNNRPLYFINGKKIQRQNHYQIYLK